MERLLKTYEVADLLGFAPSTIQDWYEQGKLPGQKLGGRLRFRESEIEAWLMRQEGPGAGGEVAPVPYQTPGPKRSLTAAPVPLRGGTTDA